MSARGVVVVRRLVVATGIALAVLVVGLTALSINRAPSTASAHGLGLDTGAVAAHPAVHHHRHARKAHRSGHQATASGSTASGSVAAVRTVVPRLDLSQVPVPSQTLLATLKGATKGYATAQATTPSVTVPVGWWGRRSVLPVINQTADRLKVRLPRRPNESTTWVNRSDVTLSTIDYAVVVDIAGHRLYVFRDGREGASYPVGVGVPATPTPTGTYFLAFHAPPTNSSYGPVMLETSAHSNAIQDFDGGSDAIIAIHGPIGADAEIGTQGAAISNGCIRMHDSDLSKIAGLPDGTPILLVR